MTLRQLRKQRFYSCSVVYKLGKEKGCVTTTFSKTLIKTML
jgi:hypothetical protein